VTTHNYLMDPKVTFEKRAIAVRAAEELANAIIDAHLKGRRAHRNPSPRNVAEYQDARAAEDMARLALGTSLYEIEREFM
jgi:hypothetical protein